MVNRTRNAPQLVMGIDLSDRSAHFFVGRRQSGVPRVGAGKVSLTEEALRHDALLASVQGEPAESGGDA